MLRVLHSELPSYLQASWPGIVPTVQRKVTDALLPMARGIERTAVEARAELDDQAAAAEVDYSGKRILGTAGPGDRLSYGYALSGRDREQWKRETTPPGRCGRRHRFGVVARTAEPSGGRSDA
jgi:hypothetical protein